MANGKATTNTTNTQRGRDEIDARIANLLALTEKAYTESRWHPVFAFAAAVGAAGTIIAATIALTKLLLMD